METENGVAELPIVEPLTEATGRILKPLRLQEQDYLEIWMEDENSFCMKAVSRKPFKRETLFDDMSNVRETLTGAKVVPGFHSASWNTRRFFSSLPEARNVGRHDWNRHGEYKVPPTDYTAVMIHACWPAERIIFRGETSRMLYEVSLRRFILQNHRARMQAEFKKNKVMPAVPKDFFDHKEYPLSDYQRVAMQMGLSQELIALFMDRGTGKTPVAISRMCIEAMRTRAGQFGEPRMMRTIVICPNQVRLNWQSEFGKFATAPGKVTVIRGAQLKRLKLLTYSVKEEDDCAFSAVIVGYDTMSNDIDFLEKIPWDLVICDESHYFKSTSTKRWKMIQRLRDVSSRRMILTGTPVANTPLDLFSQFEFLAKGMSGFSNFKAFRSWFGKFEYGVADGAGNMISKLVGLRNIPLMQERLARVSFTITKEEAGLNLPDKVYDIHEVEMTELQTEYYQKMAQHLAVKVKGEMDDAGVGLNRGLVAENILVQLLRLAQITSGFVKWDESFGLDTTGEMQKIADAVVEQINDKNPKVEAVMELLTESAQESPQEKTIIWATFVEDIRVIGEALIKADIEHGCYYGATTENKREEYVHRFNNDPSFTVLVANPATAGEGLNLLGYNPDVPEEEQLPTYCGHEIFFSQNWSYIQRSQAEDRAHRRGTKMPVRITDLVIANTIDEEIRDRVTKKGKVATLIQDISQILERILDVDFSTVGLGLGARAGTGIPS